MVDCTLYNACFFLYVFMVPAFLQYLIRAPSTFNEKPFHPVPLKTLQGQVAYVNMSNPPQTMEDGVNHCRPCYEDQYNKMGMYQWNIMLRMSYQDLIKQSEDQPVTTMYPVILASNDFKQWRVVADADDVAGDVTEETDTQQELTHISPPLLVAKLKPFGCVNNETGTTDPFQWFFASSEKAQQYKWKLVEHISTHGSVNLVACVLQGFNKVNELVQYYTENCMTEAGMQCEQSPREALGKCYALGTACGQACGFFSPSSQHCNDGNLDGNMFEGLTTKRVSIKTASGGGESNALVNCDKEECKTGLSFQGMYVEARNPNEFVVDTGGKELGDFYTVMFAMSDIEPEKPTGGLEATEDAPEDIESLTAEERRLFDVPKMTLRQLQTVKYAWQLAHVPNLTMGVFKDHASNTMRIKPTKESCYTQPGFTYIVACMTAKPVFTGGDAVDIPGPPFNDRCLAVGGLCGAACGSAQTIDEEADKYCPGNQRDGRRLDGAPMRGLEDYSPYASSVIPMEHLVKPVETRKSAMNQSYAVSFFFHGFIFFVTISYVAALLSKFPGNFSDFYPMHTWDELKTHGYVLEKFGCATAFGVSAGEDKMIVLRNWIGKIAARPEFEDTAFPSFKRWVDVFADEGHREGARLMWLAWTDFLDTNPPIEFLEEWSLRLRELSWEEAHSMSPFALMWGSGKQQRKVLPVVASQARAFVKSQGDAVPEGGVELQQDSLAKLEDFAELYAQLPANLRMEQALSKKDDCVLTREINLGLRAEGKKKGGCFTVKYGDCWKTEVEGKLKDRMAATKMTSLDQYKKHLAVIDRTGQKVNLQELTDDEPESRFPLHFRELPARKDRKVIMMYMARARPEAERKGIEKTRCLDKYLWACLKPSAVKPYDGEKNTRKQFRRQRGEARAFQKVENQADAAPSHDYHKEVRRCVQDVIERQHQKFLQTLEESGASHKKGMRGHRELAMDYLKYRVVDSTWELGRWCYGEIVGEDKDVAGDEVLILDNPSPALVELVNNIGGGDVAKVGMGLVALEQVDETSCFCLARRSARVAYAEKPSLEFFFSPYDEDEQNDDPQAFETEFRAQLCKIASAAVAKGLPQMTVTQYQQGADRTVELSGDGQIIEEVRGCVDSSIAVLNYEGRLTDNHPTVVVKKNLLMPYIGVRGKGGGLNFAVDLLQFRDGFLGTGLEQDPTPERMLFGIFDARHQPHADFWRMVLPKFMQNTDVGYTYEVNRNIAMVQAPQHFAHLQAEDDVLDVLNGMAFNIMNVIRNRCGGVTSCGTNAVWQIDAVDFSRQEEDAVLEEYFESRTKIEDTATTHQHFCRGKRSVYVQETVCTGIAKVNADYLGAVQRWAEGAVQLFWVQLFVDRTRQLLAFGWCVLAYAGLIFWLLYGSWTKELVGYNLFCDMKGAPTLLLGADAGVCRSIYHSFAFFLGHNIDRVVYKMAESQYMLLIDITLSWLLFCCGMAFVTMVLAWRGAMPAIVRRFIMMENITYFWTSLAIFFWIALTVFMVISSTPPLMFNVSHFAIYVLCIKISEHGMLHYYKSVGDSNELAIWRSQQSYMIAAPLYVMSIVQGTMAAWGIAWRKTDKSFWSASDHGEDVIRIATMWVTFIWVLLFFCVSFTVLMAFRYDLFHDIQDKFEKQCQVCACWMMFLMAITVWEPLLKFWGFDETMESLSKDEGRYLGRWWASFNIWWRTRAWIVRYMVDFALPLLILSGATGGISLLSVIATATAGPSNSMH